MTSQTQSFPCLSKSAMMVNRVSSARALNMSAYTLKELGTPYICLYLHTIYTYKRLYASIKIMKFQSQSSLRSACCSTVVHRHHEKKHHNTS